MTEFSVVSIMVTCQGSDQEGKYPCFKGATREVLDEAGKSYGKFCDTHARRTAWNLGKPTRLEA